MLMACQVLTKLYASNASNASINFILDRRIGTKWQRGATRCEKSAKADNGAHRSVDAVS